MMTGRIKDPEGECDEDEGFVEAFDDAINFPVESTIEMDWSGGSIVEEPKVEKKWLEITTREYGNFIIVKIKGILERINPLLYQGSFSYGQHKVFLEEENQHLKILFPAEIEVINNQDFKTTAKFKRIDAVMGKITFLLKSTKETHTNMLEAHIGIESTSVFKTELKFDIEVHYLKF